MNPRNSKPCEKEGVTKFHLNYRQSQNPFVECVSELSAWRRVLFRLRVIGQNPDRYAGLAFGNVSREAEAHGFIISGTGTGGKEKLSRNDYCLVRELDVEKNYVLAEGPVPPSSEALTHGAIYNANPEAGCVFHVHSSEIWRIAKELGIQYIDESIAYGTPEMARAVERIARNHDSGVIAMGGHEDGILAFGRTVGETGRTLVTCMARAL